MIALVSSPRRLCVGAFLLFGLAVAGQIFPPSVSPRPLPPRAALVSWDDVANAVRYRVCAWTNEFEQVVYEGPQTNCVVTNLARRVVWNFHVAALDASGMEILLTGPVSWPAASPAPSNRVVSVFVAWREADALAGPWRTNRVEIFSVTNPTGAHFWQTLGAAITSTNF